MKLLDIKTNTVFDYRNKCMLELLYGTGLRISERFLYMKGKVLCTLPFRSIIIYFFVLEELLIETLLSGEGNGSKKYFRGTFSSLLILNNISREKDWLELGVSILLR